MSSSVCFLRLSPSPPPPPPPIRLLPNPKTPPNSHPISTRTMMPSLNTPKTTTTVTRLSYNSDSTRPSATERLISALSYTLPFFNSVQYGRYLLVQIPTLSRLILEPLIPLLSLYRSVPYASFVAFFGLYLGVVRNPKFSRYVRFNAMQAVTLDVLLVVPLLVTRILNLGGGRGLGLKLMVWGHNAVFLVSCACFVYGVGRSVFGRTPYIPFVADAASSQIR